jgi:hypothetical protein
VAFPTKAPRHVLAHPVENIFWPTGSAPTGRYRFWTHAHGLVPAEAPVAYELQVLRGKRVTWTHAGAMAEHQEVHGPFTVVLPSGELAGPLQAAAAPDSRCIEIAQGRALFREWSQRPAGPP